MLAFHASLHARPPQAGAGPQIELAGLRLQTLAADREALATPLSVSFEEAGQSLDRLGRLLFEPDGSFVWTSSHGEQPWQVDGNVFDRGERVQFVDLKGTCPPDQLDRLLTAFGWPAQPIMFQLVREAVFLDEAEFRRYAVLPETGAACGDLQSRPGGRG